MAELLLVNPRRRRKHNPKRRAVAKSNPHRRRRRHNPRRRMTALQAQYFGKGRRNPHRRHRRRKHNPVSVRRRRNPARRYVTRRRNPSARGMMGAFSPRTLIKGTVMPAAIGAAGALGIDVIWSFLPIPINFKTGPMAPFVKILGAVGIGMLAGKFLGREIGQKAMMASVTVTMYGLVKGYAQAAMPTLPLGAYIDGMGYTQAGQFIPNESLGAYVSGVGSAHSTNTIYAALPDYADTVF